MGQLVDQSTHPSNKSIKRKSTTQSTTIHWFNDRTNRSVTPHSLTDFSTHSINQSINHSIIQSINQSSKQASKQSANQSLNQSISHTWAPPAGSCLQVPISFTFWSSVELLQGQFGDNSQDNTFFLERYIYIYLFIYLFIYINICIFIYIYIYISSRPPSLPPPPMGWVPR